MGARAVATRSELFPRERLMPTGILAEAAEAVGSAIERLAVEPAGLDAGTADLLVRLSQTEDGSLRGVEVGASCRMTPASVSRLVDRAEAAALVERLPDPDDRRAQRVTLTETGRSAAETYAPLMATVLDQLIFETLSAQERRTLISLLGRVRDRAEALLEASEARAS